MEQDTERETILQNQSQIETVCYARWFNFFPSDGLILFKPPRAIILHNTSCVNMRILKCCLIITYAIFVFL